MALRPNLREPNHVAVPKAFVSASLLSPQGGPSRTNLGLNGELRSRNLSRSRSLLITRRGYSKSSRPPNIAARPLYSLPMRSKWTPWAACRSVGGMAISTGCAAMWA